MRTKLQTLIDQTPQDEPLYLADAIRAVGADKELVTNHVVAQLVSDLLYLGYAPFAFCRAKVIRMTGTGGAE